MSQDTDTLSVMTGMAFSLLIHYKINKLMEMLSITGLDFDLERILQDAMHMKDRTSTEINAGMTDKSGRA